MSVRYHQTDVHCDLFDQSVLVEFKSSGSYDNLEIEVIGAELQIHESGTVTALNAALTRTSYSRPRIVGLPKEVFPLIRLGAWDDLLDQAQRDRDPSFNSNRMAAE